MELSRTRARSPFFITRTRIIKTMTTTSVHRTHRHNPHVVGARFGRTAQLANDMTDESRDKMHSKRRLETTSLNREDVEIDEHDDMLSFAKRRGGKKMKVPDMLCCQCGDRIPANASGMCVTCLRQNVDITNGIPRETILYQCRGCARYLGPPWMDASPESPQLMAICLKKMAALRKKVKLVNADFVWTEPHSKRLKIKIKVQKEVHNVIMQQSFVVTFVLTNQTCDECTKQVSNQTWSAVVQVRQKVKHKRTILYLEQLLLKHGAHRHATGITNVHGTTLGGGLDFFFRERNHAQSFMSFIESVAPVKKSQARQLATHDSHSNMYSFKYTYLIEIVPVCRDDIVVLPSRTASSCGQMGNLALVTGVSNVVHVIDPVSMKRGEIDRVKFWKHPFRSLCTRERMIEFIVLDVELARGKEARIANEKLRKRDALAEVTVARARDLGENDTQFCVSSFLGNILHAGDVVLGYDLTTAVFNDEDAKPMKGRSMPDVVLVKKTFPLWRKKIRTRKWKLKRMDVTNGVTNAKAKENQEDRDMETFMRDLEEDKEMRAKINLYKNEQYFNRPSPKVEEDEDVEDDFPDIELNELLDDLKLVDDRDEREDDDDDDDI